ncbi:DNA-directed DNA polymerase eta rad30 [Lunasporangiospora selenospora]|uniref:DNA polymerase eta n=1 Tax=Lunasporangiospora selenospora TaxID=979761 RepID=A0A9P6G2P6_9FUNG|nr:DNA-directed DNA polymerase eta rad30 [Lunasporangiospora selenospora]
MTTPAPPASVPAVLKRKRCFLHIDLEQNRLGLSPDIPLVSQQWNAIIAVNYPARKFGITRLHHNIFDAKQLCPELVCAHVATLGPGDTQPTYYPSPSRHTHKVSLDPFRKASAKIFDIFRRFCPKHQKGGLDEVFMDVTDEVNQRLMKEYGNDLSKWNQGPVEAIDWERDHEDLAVIFGMPKSGGNENGAYIGDDDDDEDDEGGLDSSNLDGVKSQVEEHEFESDHEIETNEKRLYESLKDTDPLEDDFDFDVDQLLDSDFDELNASTEAVKEAGLQVESISASSTTHRRGDSLTNEADSGINHAERPILETDSTTTNNEGQDVPEKSAEEIQREKEAEARRLEEEKEMLLPYYGIAEGTAEEEFWAEMQLLKAAEFYLLNSLKLRKIRNLGGKFGKQVCIDYSIERASQLWPVPLRELQERYGHQAGLELWQWCRGIDSVGIRKIKSKSMCSHKSFIPALTDVNEVQFWVSSICLELETRIQEEFDATERWPKTISVGFYGGVKAAFEQDAHPEQRKSSWKPPNRGSRSAPLGSKFEYGGVDGMTKKVFGMIEKLIKDADMGQGRPILPLILLSVTVSNFEKGMGGSMGDITKFFAKASTNSLTQPQHLHPGSLESASTPSSASNLAPTATLQSAGTIEKVASPLPVAAESPSRISFFFSPNSADLPVSSPTNPLHAGSGTQGSVRSTVSLGSDGSRISEESNLNTPETLDELSLDPAMLRCEECTGPTVKLIPVAEWEQHLDYHFALKLLEDDRKQQLAEREQQRQQQQTGKGSVGTSVKRNLSSLATLAGPMGGGAKGGSNAGKGARKRTKGDHSNTTASNGSDSASATHHNNTPGTQSLARFFKPSGGN